MAWSTPPTPGAGTVLTAAQMAIIAADLNFLRSGVFAQTTVTTSQGPTSGTTELVVASAPAVTLDGSTPVEVSFNWQAVTLTVGTDTVRVRLYDGPTAGSGTQIAEWQLAASTTGGSGFTRAILTPSAGSHTFTARLVRTAGTGTATLFANATGVPATISVTQVN